MATINGGAGNDVLNGTGADDFINGLGGNDNLADAAGNDKLDGGTGNDTLASGIGADTLLGGAGNDHLIGGADNDTLDGAAGNDTLDGGTGEDAMTGGAGNDVYIIDTTEDAVNEVANGGKDEIQTAIDGLSLDGVDNIENLTLLGAAVAGQGDGLANTLVGNAIGNKLDGRGGNDILEGRGGLDTLTGGLGDDTYIIDDVLDVVKETVGEGKDTVLTFDDFKLAAGVAVEVITAAGIADSSIDGNELANLINGNGGKNELEGAGGNDTINGAGGNDRIFGDDGNDSLVGGDGDDKFDGGAGNDTLTGGNGNDGLDGGTGNDVMIGGKGDDEYLVDSTGDKITELANQGNDFVRSTVASFTLGANLENLQLEGAALNGIGNGLNNDIVGNLGNNKLDGGVGADRLQGGFGKDTLIGGSGNDTYFLSDATGDLNEDIVSELANGGSDTITTDVDNVSLAAFSQVENLTLLGDEDIDGTGNDVANKIIGNSGKNTLTGGKGNDTLDGGLDGDALNGGLGNDTYFVDSLADTVSETTGEGKDTVFANVSYLIGANEEVEVLTLVGAGDFNLTGNKFANTLNGNAGSNILNGGDGNDTLNGGDGNDTFDGGTGNDAMAGGKGNDFYFIDSAGDKVTEAANQGIEELFSSLASFTLVANVENLELIGTGLNATGNTLSNRLSGNLADNKLDGAAGNDFLIGRDGKDALIGGAGNDTLSGGVGDDAMTGGTGNDLYFVEDAGDKTIEAAGGGVDEVRTFIDNLTLAANVENLTLEGVATFVGQGNILANVLIGNLNGNALFGGAGNDTLDGGTGKDEMFGDPGNDTFIVDNTGDVVHELTGEGKDTVKSSVDFTIKDSQEIETLILSGGATQGVGNNLANVITFAGDTSNFLTLLGNGGNDVLIGASGNDKLDGGEGNDTLDAGNGGIGEDTLLGGGGNDSLKGGNGNDLLDGGSGNDIMTGGKDDDIYIVEQVGDKATELANQGRDRVESSLASFTLGVNVEDLFLFGTGVNGIGNTLNNELRGNELANKLDGGAGNDLLAARDGADSLLGGTGNDELLGQGDADILKGGAGNDILDGGEGADIMFGEAGNDIYRYAVEGESELAALGGDTINGFQTGADKIDLSDLIDEFGIDPNAAFSGGFVLLTKNGADTLVQFDSDGAGIFGALPLTLATVVNTTVVQSDILVA